MAAGALERSPSPAPIEALASGGRGLPLWLTLASLVAAFVAIELVRPFVVGPAGFDAAASVLYFDRIAAGRHLEAFITATPKPLLTVVYGALHALTGDWRPISWATIGAYAIGVGLAGWLAARVAGPVAGAFAVAALLTSRVVLADVPIAYAVPWALAGWMAAGLALTAARPRYGLGGLALALATLARLETLAVIGVAGAAIALAWLLARTGRLERSPDPRWWLVPLIGLAAVPAMLLHDWLLTGDPLYFVSVSAHYSEAAPDQVMSPVELIGRLVDRYAGEWLFTIPAVVGTVWLLLRRAWVPLVGLAGLGPGVAAFLVLLAWRGTYVSPRYVAAVDIAMLLAAAVGAGWIAERVVERWRARAGTLGRFLGAVVMLAAIVVAAVASRPVPSLDAGFRAAAEAPRLQAARDARVEPVLACALDAIPGARTFPPAGAADPSGADPASLVVLVAGLERPRLAVDLGVPLDHIAGTPATWAQPGPGFLPYGRLVYHDRRAAGDDDAFAALEIVTPTTYGDVTLVPLLADEAEGIWVLRIDRAGGDTGGPPCTGLAGS